MKTALPQIRHASWVTLQGLSLAFHFGLSIQIFLSALGVAVEILRGQEHIPFILVAPAVCLSYAWFIDGILKKRFNVWEQAWVHITGTLCALMLLSGLFRGGINVAALFFTGYFTIVLLLAAYTLRKAITFALRKWKTR